MASPEAVLPASRARRFNPVTLGIVLRALLLGALGFLFAWLLAATRLYATALIVALLAAVVTADMVAVIRRLDREFESLLQALASGTLDAPRSGRVAFPRSADVIERAANRMAGARAGGQRREGHLQALLDTVAAALFVVGGDDRVILANRSAQRLAGESTDRLSTLPSIGGETASQLAALPPGAQRIVKLADGTQMLALCAQFSVPGEPPARLLSLQRVAGELDAVQMQAWADMTRVLAHEMMNSLTPIASLAESLGKLLRGSASDEVADALETIQRRSRGLMSFVDRYRKVAELPAPALQEVPLEPLLEDVERLMQPLFAASGVACALHGAQQNIVLRADPQLLEQALINLLRNALEAARDAPQPRVVLECGRRDDQVWIRVADNGRGVDAAALAQIFIPFFTTKPGGSGVGLSLARHIALAHGGRLEVEPAQPSGAAFTLLLPA